MKIAIEELLTQSCPIAEWAFFEWIEGTLEADEFPMEALRLLPERFASQRARCDYDECCEQEAISPLLYSFLDREDSVTRSAICRGCCRLFIGRLCEEHWHLVVIPPASWWPEPEEEHVSEEREYVDC